MRIKLEASHDNFLFLGGQELCVGWGVRHEEEADYSVKNSDCAFDEENPVHVN